MFHIVQPYVDGPRRGEQATIVSSHDTLDGALAELARIDRVLRRYRIPPQALELIVVTEDRTPVPGCESFRATPDIRDYFSTD
jgi:hypothetical protein